MKTLKMLHSARKPKVCTCDVNVALKTSYLQLQDAQAIDDVTKIPIPIQLEYKPLALFEGKSLSALLTYFNACSNSPSLRKASALRRHFSLSSLLPSIFDRSVTLIPHAMNAKSDWLLLTHGLCIFMDVNVLCRLNCIAYRYLYSA